MEDLKLGKITNAACITWVFRFEILHRCSSTFWPVCKIAFTISLSKSLKNPMFCIKETMSFSMGHRNSLEDEDSKNQKQKVRIFESCNFAEKVSQIVFSFRTGQLRCDWSTMTMASSKIPEREIPDVFSVHVLRARMPLHNRFRKSREGSQVVRIESGWSILSMCMLRERSWCVPASEKALRLRKDSVTESFSICWPVDILL